MFLQLTILLKLTQVVLGLNGGWSIWLPWGPCTSTPLGDVRSRARHCDSPPPSALGRDCQGPEIEHSRCSTQTTASPPIATHGGWSSWSPWGTCSATCNGGLQARTRTCTKPTPSRFGRACSGNDLMHQLCNNRNCPEKKVAFSVNVPTSTLTNDSTPIFLFPDLNTGSYNMATGKFTCPVAGIYLFSLSLRHNGYTTGSPYCWFRMNGNIKTYVQVDRDHYEQSSGTLILSLVVGDIVDLQCSDWEMLNHNGPGTVFSGALITLT